MSETNELLDQNIETSEETDYQDFSDMPEFDDDGNVIENNTEEPEAEPEVEEEVAPSAPTPAQMLSANLPGMNNREALVERINNAAVMDGNLGEIMVNLLEETRRRAAKDAHNISRATQSAAIYGDEYTSAMTDYLAEGMDPQVALTAAAHQVAAEKGTDWFAEMAIILQRGGYITNGTPSTNNSTVPSTSVERSPIPANQRTPVGRSSTSPTPIQGTLKNSVDNKLAAVFGLDTVKEYRG